MVDNCRRSRYRSTYHRNSHRRHRMNIWQKLAIFAIALMAPATALAIALVH